MTTTALERLLIDSCLDVGILRNVRADLPAALRAAGASPKIIDLIESAHGSRISAAVRCVRTQPTSSEIVEYAKTRAASDPIFAMRLRDEPIPTLERAFMVRFPADRRVLVDDHGNGLRVKVTGPESYAVVGQSKSAAFTRDHMTLDIDLTADNVIDEVVDIDSDIAGDDIDVDVDVDEDIAVDVDVDVDVIELTDSRATPGRTRAQWSAYWDTRRARWAAVEAAN